MCEYFNVLDMVASNSRYNVEGDKLKINPYTFHTAHKKIKRTEALRSQGNAVLLCTAGTLFELKTGSRLRT